ncbi:MAG: dienelactone hydrolase family protein [Asticcacaulis sp.]|nr:dienelactone hydrolase family protein [Asticcacaulis sp.]
MGRMITLSRPDGGHLDAYLSDIDKGRHCVIVIQEWWGLNDHIKSIVDRFEFEGFNALAPDLYHGRITKDADEASHMMDGLDFPGAVHQDIAAAFDYLKTINPSVAVMGFCMGGALTIGAAARLEGFKAAVCFYGVPPKAFADPANIKIPFQGHFGRKDDWVTPAVVADLQAAMTKAGNPPEVYSYDADHAFFNKTRPEVYDPEASELAWTRMMAFLRAKL